MSMALLQIRKQFECVKTFVKNVRVSVWIHTGIVGQPLHLPFTMGTDTEDTTGCSSKSRDIRSNETSVRSFPPENQARW